MESKAEALAI